MSASKERLGNVLFFLDFRDFSEKFVFPNFVPDLFENFVFCKKKNPIFVNEIWVFSKTVRDLFLIFCIFPRKTIRLVLHIWDFSKLFLSFFENFLQSSWDGSRLKNSNIQQLFWQKYQANSFYTYENSKNFEKNESKIISNTSPSIIHQLVIPIYEKKRLLNKFEKYKIDNVIMPDYIIINKTDKFWSNENITKDKFKIFLENESFKIYSKNLPSAKCK